MDDKKSLTPMLEKHAHLSNRRAGIEPLMGHAKQLGRSRMKNDQNTEAAGYAAILGFNLKQTVRALLDKLKSECRLKTPYGAAAF